MKTNKAWEIWGRQNPYYGVLTSDKYCIDNLNKQILDEFFSSGETYINDVFSIIDEKLRWKPRWGRAVDFGCGTGRLLIPLSKYFEVVTGVDISTSMLSKSKMNCEQKGIANVGLLETKDFLSQQSPYDFFHSCLVFQHIRKNQGEEIIRASLEKLSSEGIAVIQILYHIDRSWLRSVMNWLKNRIPYGHQLSQFIRRKPKVVAPMEMNAINLNNIVKIFYQNGLKQIHLAPSHTDNIYNLTIYGLKTIQ